MNRTKKSKERIKTDKFIPASVSSPQTKNNNLISQSDIPQHKLINSEGKQVNFDISFLGKTEQDYDYEKPHRHDFYEVILFVEGGGTHDIDFKTYEVYGKSVHFVASDNVHMVLRGKKNASSYSFLFTADYVKRELINQLPFSKTNPTVQLDEKTFKVIESLINNIKTEYLDKEAGYENIVKSYMDGILLNLQRLYDKQDPQQETKIAKPQLISNFMQMVQQQYTNHYNVEYYSEKLNVSSKHLIELCKTHLGKTPLVYIKEHTISEIKRLLFYTELSIKEIAYKLNFDDPGNFSKYFKTATGYSPVEYREGIK